MTTTIRHQLATRGRMLLGAAAWCLILAFGLLPGRATGGEVGYYVGGYQNSLTNLLNWKDGMRPGRFVESGETNGVAGGTMVFDDNATGSYVNLYPHGLYSISNMIFGGAAVSKNFVIPQFQTIYLEPGGRLEIEEGSEKTLSFGGSTFLNICDVSQEGEYIDIVNNSSHVLSLGSFGNTQSSTAQLRPEFRFSGSGDIVLAQNSFTPNGWHADKQGSAPVFVFNQTGTFSHQGLHETVLSSLVVPPSDTSRRIELVTNGFKIYEVTSGGTSDALTIGADTVITGPQGLRLGYGQYRGSTIVVAQGKTLTLDICYLETEYPSSSLKGIWFKGGGTTVFTEAVTNLAEQCYIENSTVVKSPIVGAADSEISPMGRGPCVSVANSGRFVYTGPGETTDRGIQIRYASSGYLEQGGTGPLEMSGNCVIASTGSSNLYLVNETENEGTYSGLLADNGAGKLAVHKRGSGLWRINCAATYTGATTVNAGTLALGPSGSIENSDLQLNGGTLRIEKASAVFKSLTLSANSANGLAVADGVVYSLPAFTRNTGASLDVTLGSGSSLELAGLSDGKTPAWLTVNGRNGWIADGRLVTVDDITHSIDAKGGVIPDNALAIVGITTASGSGTDVSLAAATTSARAVNQLQGSVDARLSLKGGETLNVAEIVVSEGARPLTVAADGGAAALFGLDEDFVSLNPASGAVLNLDGALAVASAKIRGLGTVSVGSEVSLSQLTTAESPTLATEAGSLLELDSWAISNAAAFYAGPGAISVDSLTLGGAETADSSLVISGGTVTNKAGVFRKGSGYLRMDGGTFVETGTGNPAWGPSPSQVTFEQTGGVYRHEGQFVIGGWDTQVGIYLSGGQFTINGSCEFPTWGAGCNRYTADGNRLNYILTVDGESAFKANTVYMARINTGAAYSNSANEWANPTMINFNGGTGDVWLIRRDYTREQSPSSRAFVNFNGGTLKTTNANGAFGSGSQAIDRVTVFAGGCTFNTADSNIASDMPLSAPYGNGVASVPVPAEVLARTFTAPPSVTIIGDGEGASARVLFNPATGKVTGVQVLTPGWGYTSAKARFNHGGYASVGESTVELDAVKCGQFVKAGNGTYTFNCTNTVTDVKVTGGSIKNDVNDVFPSNATLTLDGGNYDVNGHAQTFKSVAFGPGGGTILNGTATVGDLIIDFAEAVAGRPGVADMSNVTFPAQAKIVLDGYDSSAFESLDKIVLLNFAQGGAPSSLPPLDDSSSLPKGWQLRLSATSLKAVYSAGLSIFVR